MENITYKIAITPTTGPKDKYDLDGSEYSSMETALENFNKHYIKDILTMSSNMSSSETADSDKLAHTTYGYVLLKQESRNLPNNGFSFVIKPQYKKTEN